MSHLQASREDTAHEHEHENDCSAHVHGFAGRVANGQGAPTSSIGLAFALNFAFSVIEIVGGLWIGSVAILAGAVHDLGDAASLAFAWFLERYSSRAPDRRFNFGYRRFSLLSAVVSAAIIVSGSLAIAIQAVSRLRAPSLPQQGWGMVWLALAGLAVNGFAAFKLSLGKTQNERVLTWHLLEDVFSWSLVLIGAVAIALTGQAWLDSALALGLSGFVLFNVARHLRQTFFLFLQGRPANFDEEEFVRSAAGIEGVARIDSIRAWSLDGNAFVLAMRLDLSVATLREAERVKGQVRELAAQRGADRGSIAIETRPAAAAPGSHLAQQPPRETEK